MEDGELPTAKISFKKCEVEESHFLTLRIAVLPPIFGFEANHLLSQMY